MGLAASLVVGDIVAVGYAMMDVANPNVPAMKAMPPGDVRGFDVRTSEQVWIFRTMPPEGAEPANATWLTAITEDRASWESSCRTRTSWSVADHRPGTGLRLRSQLDARPTDYDGGYRPGDNLFAESIVWVDATTGRAASATSRPSTTASGTTTSRPGLNVIHLEVEGRDEPVKALAAVSEQAFTYVFDRVTG